MTSKARTAVLAAVAVAGLSVSCATPVTTLPTDYAMTGNEGIVMGRVIGLSPAWKA